MPPRAATRGTWRCSRSTLWHASVAVAAAADSSRRACVRRGASPTITHLQYQHGPPFCRNHITLTTPLLPATMFSMLFLRTCRRDKGAGHLTRVASGLCPPARTLGQANCGSTARAQRQRCRREQPTRRRSLHDFLHVAFVDARPAALVADGHACAGAHSAATASRAHTANAHAHGQIKRLLPPRCSLLQSASRHAKPPRTCAAAAAARALLWHGRALPRLPPPLARQEAQLLHAEPRALVRPDVLRKRTPARNHTTHRTPQDARRPKAPA